MEMMTVDVYATFAVLTFIVCTLVGMIYANKNDELIDGAIIAIPVISIEVGLLWPLAYIAGIFLGSCYLLAYLVKKVS